MKLLIDLDEEYVKAIDKIKFLVGGRTDRKLQLEIIKAIKNGKVLEQEPRKGHWKLVQRGKCIDVCCSNCEAVRIKGYAYNYTIDQLDKNDLKECFECADMRYCPNCGADMREVKE